jgi:uncharacterized membrane protein (DUF373 family)
MNAIHKPNEPLIRTLRMIIRFGVRCMAILMTLVILWGVGDVAMEMYNKLIASPFMMLTISDILATFGAFMAVLIAIEIFINITIYLRHDIIHVQIVMATALMAIARKVIILDFKTITPDYMFATAALIFAMSIGYWFVVRNVDAKTVYCDQFGGNFSDSEECDQRNEHSMARGNP